MSEWMNDMRKGMENRTNDVGGEKRAEKKLEVQNTILDALKQTLERAEADRRDAEVRIENAKTEIANEEARLKNKSE